MRGLQRPANRRGLDGAIVEEVTVLGVERVELEDDSLGRGEDALPPHAAFEPKGASREARAVGEHICRCADNPACLADLRDSLDRHIRALSAQVFARVNGLHLRSKWLSAEAPPLPCSAAESARDLREGISAQCFGCLQMALRHGLVSPGRDLVEYAGVCGYRNLCAWECVDGCWGLTVRLRAPSTARSQPGHGPRKECSASPARLTRSVPAAGAACRLCAVPACSEGRYYCALDVTTMQPMTASAFGRAAALARLLLHDVRQTGLLYCARHQPDCQGMIEPHASVPVAATIGSSEARPARYRRPGHPRTPQHARDLVQAAINMAASDLAHPLGMKRLAAELHVNRAYLSALITETTGRSFRLHLRDLRVAHAKSLLQDPRLQIADIACALGFATADSFRLAFKAWTGVAPSLWREEQ